MLLILFGGTRMITTYQVSTNELSYDLIDAIKSLYKNKEIVIDVYQNEDLNLEVGEITNSEIIGRINDVNNNQKIITPNILL